MPHLKLAQEPNIVDQFDTYNEEFAPQPPDICRLNSL